MTPGKMQRQSILILFFAAMIPLILYGFFSQFWMRNRLVLEAEEQLSIIRDEKISTVDRQLNDAAVRWQAAVEEIVANRLPVYFLSRENLLESLFLFNQDYSYSLTWNQSGDLSGESEIPAALRLELQKADFQEKLFFKEIEWNHGSSRLAVFTDLSGSAPYLAVFIVNYDALLTMLNLPPQFTTMLINDSYQLIDSETNHSTRNVVLGSLTERMLDGFSETGRYDDQWHGFGVIDLPGENIFLDIVLSSNDVVGSLRQYQLFLTFFSLAAGVIALVIAWSFSRDILRFGEGIAVNQIFRRDLRFLQRLDRTLQNVNEKIDLTTRLGTDLNFLRNDISTMKEALKPEDPESS